MHIFSDPTKKTRLCAIKIMRRQKIDLNFGHLMPKKECKKPGESSFNNAKPLAKWNGRFSLHNTRVNPLKNPLNSPRLFPPIRPRMTANLPT